MRADNITPLPRLQIGLLVAILFTALLHFALTGLIVGPLIAVAAVLLVAWDRYRGSQQMRQR